MIELFFSFFKIGLFAVGGGLATLPFLYELAKSGNFGITPEDISNMVAISESTPGPLGVNMATYVGFFNNGPLGSIIATIGLIMPSIIISIIIARMLQKFRSNQTVKDVFYGLRAASCALITVAGIGVAKLAFFSEKVAFFWQGAVLAVLLFFGIKKLKWHPVAFIAISAVIGIIFKFDL